LPRWLAAFALLVAVHQPVHPVSAGTTGETPDLAAERALPQITLKTAAAAPKPALAPAPISARPVELIHALAADDCGLSQQLMDMGVAVIVPVFGATTQPFAVQHPGLDLYALPDALVHSAHDGEVTFAGWNREGYGLLVTVQHPPIVITSPVTVEVQLKTHYAHLSRIDVAPGAQVLAGQLLGEVGQTGRANGPHLHFEVRLDSVAVNPECFWVIGRSD
jgi:murein DD-endopeptidase MepM/ murein hydrolase activator NlpD